MFLVKGYKITEDPRKMVKTLIDTGADRNIVFQRNMNFKQGQSKIDIVFTRMTEGYADTNECRKVNYIHNSTLDLYYFVKEIKVLPTNIIEYICHLDVLMTYATQIKALNVTLDRSETIFNGYLPDSEYTALGYRAIVCKAFPDALDDDSYVLMTTG